MPETPDTQEDAAVLPASVRLPISPEVRELVARNPALSPHLRRLQTSRQLHALLAGGAREKMPTGTDVVRGVVAGARG